MRHELAFIFFKRQLTVNFLSFDDVFMSLFQQHIFSFNCTTKPDDFTASYKLRSLKHFFSTGDFKPSDERVHTDKPQISKRAVSQACQTI